MLRRNIYKGCKRLYWQPEDFEAEAPDATFEYRGEVYHLEFDGLVDELILKGRRKRSSLTIDITELSGAIPLLKQAAHRLGTQPRVDLDFGSGKRWTATSPGIASGPMIIFRSGLGQTAALTKSKDNRALLLTLRTQGRGILHEIKARTDLSGSIVTVAEAVTVF